MGVFVYENSSLGLCRSFPTATVATEMWHNIPWSQATGAVTRDKSSGVYHRARAFPKKMESNLPFFCWWALEKFRATTHRRRNGTRKWEPKPENAFLSCAILDFKSSVTQPWQRPGNEFARNALHVTCKALLKYYGEVKKAVGFLTSDIESVLLQIIVI